MRYFDNNGIFQEQSQLFKLKFIQIFSATFVKQLFRRLRIQKLTHGIYSVLIEINLATFKLSRKVIIFEQNF